jgi:hypothetical protein
MGTSRLALDELRRAGVGRAPHASCRCGNERLSLWQALFYDDGENTQKRSADLLFAVYCKLAQKVDIGPRVQGVGQIKIKPKNINILSIKKIRVLNLR